MRAEIVNRVFLHETHVEGQSTIQYQIGNAPTAPSACVCPGIQECEIRQGLRSDEPDPQSPNDWIITLQDKRIGNYALSFTWEWDGWSLNQTNTFNFEGLKCKAQLLDDGLPRWIHRELNLLAPVRHQTTPRKTTRRSG